MLTAKLNEFFRQQLVIQVGKALTAKFPPGFYSRRGIQVVIAAEIVFI